MLSLIEQPLYIKNTPRIGERQLLRTRFYTDALPHLNRNEILVPLWRYMCKWASCCCIPHSPSLALNDTRLP